MNDDAVDLSEKVGDSFPAPRCFQKEPEVTDVPLASVPVESNILLKKRKTTKLYIKIVVVALHHIINPDLELTKD